MRTLFVKIFLSFWLAMGLIVAGIIALTALAASERTQALDSIDPTELAQSATTALAQGGVPALKKWAEQTQDSVPGVPIYLIDDAGHDILDRIPSERTQHRLQHWTALPGIGFGRNVSPNHPPRDGDTPETTFLRNHEPRFMPEIVTADGLKYLLIFAISDASLVNVFGKTTIAITLFGLAMGVSGLICWWLARSFSAPISRLQASARSLAAGDLDARVDRDFAMRRDELGVLGRDFNHMADQLRAMLRSKQTLLRDLSHELRSPLARLRVALTLARRNGPSLTLQLDRIERDAERLDQLIGQILQLSRLTVAEPGCSRELVDLTELVTEIVEDARLEGMPDKKRVEWSPDSETKVLGDPEMIRRAVENVVRNAIRLTPPEMSVEISLRHDNDAEILVVQDSGPGVPTLDLERIFEPFYRVADTRDLDRGGVGLGLTITATVMALHGGFVRAANGLQNGLIVEMGFRRGAVRGSIPVI